MTKNGVILLLGRESVDLCYYARMIYEIMENHIAIEMEKVSDLINKREK